MKKVYVLLLTILTLFNLVYSQQQVQTKYSKIPNLEIPKTQPNEVIIFHTGYSLSYNEKYEQANWVAYELTKEETNKLFDRTNKFIPDPLVKTGTANEKDYAGSGYDKGHLAPAADMSWSTTAMAESFYYSNMSPQEPGFNRGIWKRLEDIVRTWAIENNSIYIVTGPVLTNGLPTIGADKVAIPKYFYKVILDYTEPGIKGIGFIIPNKSSSEQLQSYSVTIDSVEKFTGIDFFPLLPDEQENIIESTLDLKSWIWVDSKSTNENGEISTSVQRKGTYLHESQQGNDSINQTAPIKTERRSKPVQCSAIKKSGSRCKRMTYSPNGQCYQHGGD